jgi:hypothetical protein
MKKMVEDSFTQYRLKIKNRNHPKAIRFSREDGSFFLTIRDRKHWENCTKIWLRTSDNITFYGINPTNESVWIFRSKPSDWTIKATLTRGLGKDGLFLHEIISRVISNS